MSYRPTAPPIPSPADSLRSVRTVQSLAQDQGTVEATPHHEEADADEAEPLAAERGQVQRPEAVQHHHRQQHLHIYINSTYMGCSGVEQMPSTCMTHGT